jgi:CPA2 family monovalent cation:H+ antiporter-2
VHELDLILTLAMAFAGALVLGYITQRLGLSPILGYLLAGVVIGPFTPGPVADAGLAAQLAEVGVILLMFGVGLHFHLKDLLAVRRIAIPGAIGQSLIATLLGAGVARFLGWGWGAGVVLGIAVSVASTVVLMRVLMDNDELGTPQGHIAVGWLIVEDLFTVLVLVLLPAVASSVRTGTASTSVVLTSIGMAVLKMGLLALIVLVAGGRIVPWALTQVARTRSRELFTLAVLTFALVIAAGSSIIFGASMALGAFLAGMVVGQSKLSEQAAADALPMRDAFAVLFFVSVGMLFDPRFLLAKPLLVLAVLAIILVAKPLVALGIVLGLGYSVSTALTVAIGLAQIGEFSFILAGLARKEGVLPKEGESVLVASALLSISVNPVLFRAAGRFEAWLRGKRRLWRLLNRRAEASTRLRNTEVRGRIGQADPRVRAIVVGYGPVGQTVKQILDGFAIQPIVIDLNVDTIKKLTDEGVLAIYGDAGKQDILRAAGIETAKYLIVTLPDLASRTPVLAAARQLNGDLSILSRAHYLTERESLEQLGATAIFIEEAEAAVGLSEMLLRAENAAEDRIAAETDRIRAQFAIRRAPFPPRPS